MSLRPASILGWAMACTAVGFGLAAWARYGLVEVDGLEALCRLQTDWRCALREGVIQAFLHHRLGTVALACAALALWWRQAAVAMLALVLAGAGLVLYNADASALACVAAAVALQRARDAARDAAHQAAQPGAPG